MEDREFDFETVVKEFAPRIAPNVSIAKPGETYVIASRIPKTAAMFFDKVWSHKPSIPDEIRLYGDSEFERAVVTYSVLNAGWTDEVRKSYAPERGDAFARLVDEVKSRQSLRFAEILLERYGPAAGNIADADALFRTIDRLIGELLYKQHGLALPTFLEKDADYECQYRYGDVSTVVATLSGLGVMDEEQLRWAQVLEFRKDVENRSKIKRLVHFFDENWQGKPIELIQYSLEKKIEDYTRSLEKHGVKTVLGTLRSIASSRLVVGAGSAGGTALMLHEPIAALAAAALTVTGCAISLSEQLRDLKDFQSDQREIAFVHSLQRFSGSS